ncbi:MAG TPA: hypothetical protein PKD09_21795 [Aggregatilinea sp.]|uniref:hypothetical protein n=1 Tax=Aggregatilinea sp. TaxID=2806333 RepID=UPI002D18A99F|nr:hypothetical protein [Aggregatilinea sp.]HML24304.1 hypothetical protein [Aggregatilinea sp.]
MVKKVVLGVLFTGLIGILVYGAINRTVARTQSDEGGQESGETHGNGTGAGGGRGQAGGGGQTGDLVYIEGEDDAGEWVSVQGVAMDVSETELVLDADGETVLVEGRPWSYAVEQGFDVQPGDRITLNGYYEGDEFKVGVIENAASARRIQLRTASGAPMWGRGGRQ